MEQKLLSVQSTPRKQAGSHAHRGPEGQGCGSQGCGLRRRGWVPSELHPGAGLVGLIP